MKITFFIYSLQGGGAERMVSRLANAMAELGHQVDIYLFDLKGIQYQIDNRIHVYNVSDSTKGIRRFFNRIKGIGERIRSEKPDYIFVFMIMLIPYAVLGKIFSGNRNTKIIGAERANPRIWNRFYRVILGCFLPFCRGFVFQTEGAKSLYPKYIQKRAVVIGNIAPDIKEERKFNNLRHKTVCSVGRLHDDKDFWTLIKAFQIVVKTKQNAELHIYGEGPQKRELMVYADSLGIGKNIIFNGFSKNIAEELLQYEVFAFSSPSEGMPNALLEAMASGLPCVSTNCDFGPSELITDGVNGFLVDVGDACMMAERIVTLLDNRQLREKIGRNAKYVCSNYSQKRIVDQYLKYVESI